MQCLQGTRHTDLQAFCYPLSRQLEEPGFEELPPPFKRLTTFLLPSLTSLTILSNSAIKPSNRSRALWFGSAGMLRGCNRGCPLCCIEGYDGSKMRSLRSGTKRRRAWRTPERLSAFSAKVTASRVSDGLYPLATQTHATCCTPAAAIQHKQPPVTICISRQQPWAVLQDAGEDPDPRRVPHLLVRPTWKAPG